MRTNQASINPEPAISDSAGRSLPDPALIGTRKSNLLPETFFNGSLHAMALSGT